MKRMAGFTLLEVLAALMLLAFLLVGVYSGIHTATRTVHAGQARIEQFDQIRAAQHFGVSVLAQDQLHVSSHFAGRPVEGFRPDFDRLQGLPVVRGAAVHVAARLEHAYPCGDHTLYVGRVLALRGQAEKPPPLLYHGGRYAAAQPMSC